MTVEQFLILSNRIGIGFALTHPLPKGMETQMKQALEEADFSPNELAVLRKNRDRLKKLFEIK